MFGKGTNKIRVVERKLYEVGIFGPPYCAGYKFRYLHTKNFLFLRTYLVLFLFLIAADLHMQWSHEQITSKAL